MKKKEHQNSGTLDKDTINNWIIPFLSVGKRGFKSNFDLASIFLLILKRLKTGVQWRELPIESYFEKGEISWQNVYYYFNKWSKDVSFQRVWLNLISKKKRKLDMSCVQLDDSHTCYRQKGESAGYQARKKAVTTNSIFLCDNKGQMIAMGSPKAGNHNDLYEIEEVVLKEILALLEEAAIEHKDLFLNADAGFDSKSLRDFLESKEIIANIKPNPRNGEQPDVYFDEELYKNRFKIEQANGWLDGYKGLIMRYEYLDVTWIGMLLLGFISKFLKKV